MNLQYIPRPLEIFPFTQSLRICPVLSTIFSPKFQYLVNVTGSGAYYAERDCYGSDLLDESGVAVVRFESPLLFNNVALFKKQVIKAADNIKG